MKITLIAQTKFLDQSLNEDYMPCLAARVSFGRDGLKGEEADTKLIQFLGEHHHTSPFEHVSLTFKVECPIFIAREWMRHRTQSYNEISMRYTDKTIGTFWYPTEWRKEGGYNKQGSEGLIEDQEKATQILNKVYDVIEEGYRELRGLTVAKEQARTVIPVGHYTEFYATANFLNWIKFLNLRTTMDTQKETREIALQIKQILLELFPESAKALLTTIKGE